MSAPVLDTIDNAIRRAHPSASPQHALWHVELVVARIAVAELIAAAQGIRDCGGWERSDPGSRADMQMVAAKNRLDAALARTRGEA